jgi:hypothetical protein
MRISGFCIVDGPYSSEVATCGTLGLRTSRILVLELLLHSGNNILSSILQLMFENKLLESRI